MAHKTRRVNMYENILSTDILMYSAYIFDRTKYRQTRRITQLACKVEYQLYNQSNSQLADVFHNFIGYCQAVAKGRRTKTVRQILPLSNKLSQLNSYGPFTESDLFSDCFVEIFGVFVPGSKLHVFSASGCLDHAAERPKEKQSPRKRSYFTRFPRKRK